jgi:hypothetical protein
VHFIAEDCRLTTLPAIKNRFAKCGCLDGTVCTNGDNIPTLMKNLNATVHGLLECSSGLQDIYNKLCNVNVLNDVNSKKNKGYKEAVEKNWGVGGGSHLYRHWKGKKIYY